MLSYENDELITVKVCPRCAKERRGRGILTNEKGFLNKDISTYTECLLCGWFGDEDQCQEYCFPCEVQQIVVMDLEVLQNLWAFALRKDEAVEIDPLNGGHYEGDPPYNVRAKDCRDRLMKGLTHCSITYALRILVARGCLLPGFYKIMYEELEKRHG